MHAGRRLRRLCATRTMHSPSKSILALPLAPGLPHHLSPDAAVPSVAALLALSQPPSSGGVGSVPASRLPSILRRSRAVSKGAAFSYTTPLLKEFPYDVVKTSEVRKVNGDEVAKPRNVVGGGGDMKVEKVVGKAERESEEVTKDDIESYLAALEPSLDHVVKAVSGDGFGITSPARDACYRDPTGGQLRYSLTSVSQEAAEQCVPDLNTGKQGDEHWQELSQVLSGHVVIIRKEGEDVALKGNGFAPWSLAYAGHQFGSFAGQLGDGRAVSILTTPSTSSDLTNAFNLTPPSTTSNPIVELQLKGAGRTPFSRFADGLAVLRSSVREYLGAEACHALPFQCFPTSRSLALVSAPSIRVRRERIEGAAIVTRVAPSWLRIGSFELCGWKDDWAGLFRLVRYTANQVLGVEAWQSNQHRGKSFAAAVLKESAIRNANMVAAWQAYGFMHGVINTDNVSLLGLTIDYGPYAFMDVFDQNHICNHSDDGGRYSYKMQPTMVLFAIRKLGEMLTELIGAELEASEQNIELNEDWADSASREQLAQWSEKGTMVANEILQEFQVVFMNRYKELMTKRMGFSTRRDTDFTGLFSPFLDLMESYSLDYSTSFRLLSKIPNRSSSSSFDSFVQRFLQLENIPKAQQESAQLKCRSWFATYQQRLESEVVVNDGDKNEIFTSFERRQRIREANPRFVLRQWILEEVISKLEQKSNGQEGEQLLEKVLNMARRPCLPYGEEEEGDEEVLMCTNDEEVKEVKRLCGMGSKDMLGFQCSCSS